MRKLLLFLLLLPVVFASQRTIVLTADDVTDDVTVLESNPTSRLNTGTLYAGYADSSIKEYRSYFIWDISDLPNGTSAIYDAQFYLDFYNVAYDSSAGQTLYLTHVKDLTWDGQTESTMTWNNQVCGAGFNDAMDCNLTVTDSVYYTFASYVGEPTYNITKIIEYALANTQNKVSFAINDSDDGSPHELLYFRSSEYGNANTITITYENVAPNITATVSPLIAYDNQNLYGYCLGTDVDGDTLGYYWKWFVNSTVYSSGYNGTYVEGVSTKLSTITLTNTHDNDNWIFSCRATDTDLNSTWVNSTVVGVSSFYFDDCSLASNITMVARHYFEDLPNELLNYTLNIEGEYWFTTQPETTKEFHLNFSGNSSYNMCIFPDNASVQADIYLKNIVDNSFTHRYYLFNQTFTNIPLYINLYNFKNTTTTDDVVITTRKKNYDYFQDVVVKMQRNYIQDGEWRTVQMDKSDDFGSVIFHAKEQEEDYRFLFYDTNNCLLYTSKSTKFLCPSGSCELTVFLDECADIVIDNNLNVEIAYDNSSGIINVSWDDSNNVVSSVQVMVTKETMIGSTVICNNTALVATGYQICNISAYDGTIKVQASYTASPEHAAITEYIFKVVNQLSHYLSVQEQALWAAGIILTVAMIGVFSPVACVVAALIGLIAVWYLGLLSALSSTMLTVVTIIVVAVILKVKN